LTTAARRRRILPQRETLLTAWHFFTSLLFVSTHSDLRIFFSDFQADAPGNGTTEALLDSLEEVSRLLHAYSKAILDSSSDS
jgi:hypothetical protein